MTRCPKPRSDKNSAVLQGVEGRLLDSQFCAINTIIPSEFLKTKSERVL